MPTTATGVRSALLSAVGLPDTPATLGRRGERAAARHLRRRGYTIVAGGYRNRYGEIDLVAVWKKQVVVFVEVKTRRGLHAGAPAEAVDALRRRRLTNAGLAFLKSHGLLEYPARFDVVSIHWPRGARRPAAIDHIENAFEAEGFGRFYG